MSMTHHTLLGSAPPRSTAPEQTETRGRREGAPGAQRSSGAWSFRIGRVAGIDVHIHATFLMLLGWVALSHVLEGHGLIQALGGVLFVIAVFVVVVLHELGHALTARRFGIRTRDITLLPIGGVARLERMPDDPRQELLIALAGPAVNVVLAALFFGLLLGLEGTIEMTGMRLSGGPFLSRMMWLNVSLALFNLLPAFPMDGGRVLRAALSTRMGRVRATETAARLGKGMAILLGLVGLLYNPLLVFIALFVWMGAGQEAAMVELRSALIHISVGQAMITDFQTIDADAPLGHALDHILAGFQGDFPVMYGGELVGVLTRDDVLRALPELGPDAPVGSAMQRSFEVADPSEPLADAFARLEGSKCRSLPVVRGGAVVGMLTPEHVGELLAVQQALGRTRRAAMDRGLR